MYQYTFLSHHLFHDSIRYIRHGLCGLIRPQRKAATYLKLQ